MHLDDETKRTAQPNESQHSPAPEDLALSPPAEEDTTQSLIPVTSQGTTIERYDEQQVEPPDSPPPDGFALLSPPEHEPAGSNVTTLDQETDPVHWTQWRDPLRYHSPPSSLPARRYISPREHNPAARLTTAMAHRAHTPMPQIANGRATKPKAMLTQFKQHGVTTYDTESTEQVELDPALRDDRDVLKYTDKVPMAGKYLWNTSYRRCTREQEAMLRKNYREDVADAETAHLMARWGPRTPGR